MAYARLATQAERHVLLTTPRVKYCNLGTLTRNIRGRDQGVLDQFSDGFAFIEEVVCF